MACSELLLRGVVELRHMQWDPSSDTPLVRSAAFLLRRSDDFLSADRLALSSVQDAFDRWEPPAFREGMPAAVSLHTGRVRDAGLIVEARPEPGNPAHAGILGLPQKEDDYARAMALASDLQEMARFVRYRDPSVPDKLRRRWERQQQQG